MPPALDRALRSIAAGLCGSAAHTILMTLKAWFGWLPAFRPYDGLQALLASLTGSDVPALVPWLLTYFNGAVVLGLIYGRNKRRVDYSFTARKLGEPTILVDAGSLLTGHDHHPTITLCIMLQ